MKIVNYSVVIISDTHTMHKGLAKRYELPPADFIIHCGDITGRGDEHTTKEFLTWFSGLDQYDHKIFIAGNHDRIFEEYPKLARELIPENVTYVENEEVVIDGLKFWGSPHTTPFNNWAFNTPEHKLHMLWQMIPDDTDIVITHGAPYAIMDLGKSGSNEHTGSQSLYKELLDRVKPKIHCFGHIHEYYGMKTIDNTKFINASVLNEFYRIANPPIHLMIEKEFPD